MGSSAKRTLFTLAPASVLLSLMSIAGCVASSPAHAPAPALDATPMATVRMAGAHGAVQCGGRGTAPQVALLELQRAGLHASNAACATDGRMHAAVCGGTTGELNLFDVAVTDVERARSLGLTPMAEWGRDAQVVPCR